MSVSTLPHLHEFFHAILALLAHHPDRIRRRDIYEPVSDAMRRLSQGEREEQLPSGGGHYRYRIGLSMHELKTVGYAEPPVSGLWRITTRGRDVLAVHPDRLGEATACALHREAHLADANEPGGEVPESRRAVVEHPRPPRNGSRRPWRP